MTREQGTLNWEQVLGNFTFSYLCRFFYVHLLTADSFVMKYIIATSLLAGRGLGVG
ncbi:MAG: hypothetical protein ACKPE1_30835 [Dolichospermum sp.]